jgi:hypothetical protein
METTISDSTASAKTILRRVLLIYLGLAIVSLIFGYLSGELRDSLPWALMSWPQAAAFALILEYGRWLCIPSRRSHIYRVLFLAPALVQIGRDITNSISYGSLESVSLMQNIFLLLAALEVSLAIFGARLVGSAYIDHMTRLNVPVGESEVTKSSAHEALPNTNILPSFLGRGDGYIDRVINSVIRRSVKSEQVANFSLTIMLILVMIGGMASFGLWVFTHADRISTLEYERSKLTKLQTEVKEIRDKLGANSESLKPQIDRLLKFIEDNYSESEPYKVAIARLSQQSQTNYADIAIRVTIAVLTIFLVQVFFSVYKYNRHLAIMLAAKAEALELAGNDDDARKELSREAVSIIKESVPGFGPQPRTPIDHAVRAVEGLRKT